jgi:hypothetical protein
MRRKWPFNIEYLFEVPNPFVERHRNLRRQAAVRWDAPSLPHKIAD